MTFVAGCVISYFWQKSRFENSKNILEVQLNSTISSLQSQLDIQKQYSDQRIQDFEQNEIKLREAFSKMAQEALAQNLDSQLKALQKQNTADLELKKQSFDQSFTEIQKNLKITGDQIHQFEKERVDQYSKIEKQIHTMAQQEQKLIQETERLKSALTTSQSVRGRWGELVLRNILEQSDLVSGIDFEEQLHTIGSEGGTLKPDFVVKLPQSGQHLVIDSKASIFDSYLESETAQDDAARKTMHLDFAKRLRSRIQELSGKEYQKHVANSLPYVILFVPSEAAIRAAFDVDPQLFQYAMERRVFISSPATILPLIMLIAHAWKQYRLSERASELANVIDTLGSRLETFVNRLGRVQSGLDQATRGWNEAIDKSWNGQQSVLKSIDKARELGGNLSEVKALEMIDQNPRAIEIKPESEMST